jgi:hypothetical protein
VRTGHTSRIAEPEGCGGRGPECPVSTEGGTRRVQLVREGGGGGPECAARLSVRPVVRSFYPGETSGDRRVPEQNLALVGVLGTPGSRVNVTAHPSLPCPFRYRALAPARFLPGPVKNFDRAGQKVRRVRELVHHLIKAGVDERAAVAELTSVE